MILNPTFLRQGTASESVRNLQIALNGLSASVPPLATDGKFGPATAAAVINFQRRAGILADGIVGPVTARAMVSAGVLLNVGLRKVR